MDNAETLRAQGIRREGKDEKRAARLGRRALQTQKGAGGWE